jgi:hypothetical protein
MYSTINNTAVMCRDGNINTNSIALRHFNTYQTTNHYSNDNMIIKIYLFVAFNVIYTLQTLVSL